MNSYIQGMTEAKSAYEGFECYRTSSETLEKTKSFENEVKGHIELSPCNDSSSESQESEESRNDELYSKYYYDNFIFHTFTE